jgi:hypothetical protein
MSAELIHDVHHDGTMMKAYLRPLIQGSIKYITHQGVIQRAILKKVKVK